MGLCAALVVANQGGCQSGDDDGATAGSGGSDVSAGGASTATGGDTASGRVPATGGTGASGGASGSPETGGEGGVQGGTGGTASMADDAGLAVDAGFKLDAGNMGTGGAPAPQDLPPALRDAGAVALFPAPDAKGVCPDPPLRITFSAPPTLGTRGKIQVFDTAQPATAVASVDMAASNVSDTIGGTVFTMQRPAYVDGNDAVVYLRAHALSYGHSYFVRVDSGAISGPGNTAVAISDAMTWTFSTAAAAPNDLSSLTVALDGGGDFCSVQGAIDATPGSSEITIARGTYHEIIRFKSKNNLTLRGADRKATIIAGTNNENMNGGTAKRALVGIDGSSGVVIEMLTIHNLTPQGGSQAEALRMQTCDKCIVRDADIISLQDTLLWSGRIYASNCYIAGNVDFIWGTGAAYFDSCEIKTLGRKGYNVQARNAAAGYGYVFVDSRLTSDPGITGNWLGRIDSNVYPASHIAYINCEMGSHIDPAGWQVTGGGTSSLRFWEYQSKTPGGAAVNVSQRLSGSRQITSEQAAMMRDPSVVLGGWMP